MATTAAAQAVEKNITSVALANIQPSNYNPRKNFDETSLAELAESIRQQGVSLMMRKLRKGTLYRWQVCAMAADSISTARPPGKRCLMVSSSIRLVMNRSPVQTSPLWMRLSIPASFSDKACLNREGQIGRASCRERV